MSDQTLRDRDLTDWELKEISRGSWVVTEGGRVSEISKRPWPAMPCLPVGALAEPTLLYLYRINREIARGIK